MFDLFEMPCLYFSQAVIYKQTMYQDVLYYLNLETDTFIVIGPFY